jgi:hypothetical protein
VTSPRRRPRVAATLAGVAAVLACAACDEVRHQVNREYAGLDGDVARVGDLRAGPAFVAAVAEAQGISAPQALDFVVDDMVLAQAAHRQGLDRGPVASWAMTAALAGRVATQIGDEARSRGPASAEEHSTRRIIHAVVLRTGTLEEERALAIAEAIEGAVEDAATDEQFEARAHAILHTGARVVIERLGPFTVDGELPSGGLLDPSFVAAAFALHAPGAVSPVVRTSFGWHVIRRSDDPGAPSARLSPEVDGGDSAASPMDDVVRIRALQATQVVLREQRAKTGVSIESGADATMARLFGDSP